MVVNLGRLFTVKQIVSFLPLNPSVNSVGLLFVLCRHEIVRFLYSAYRENN